MQLDFSALTHAQSYKILCSLVVPRPIALVTTVDAQGCVNAAPFSFFNVLGANPPIIGFAPGNRDDGSPKDTSANLAVGGECVVHLVDETIGQQMANCAWPYPPGESELPHAGFTAAASRMVKPPRISEAQVALECKVLDIRYYGENRLVIAQILCATAKDGLLNPENLRLNAGVWAPIGRMESPGGYCRTADKFTMLPKDKM